MVAIMAGTTVAVLAALSGVLAGGLMITLVAVVSGLRSASQRTEEPCLVGAIAPIGSGEATVAEIPAPRRRSG